MNKLVSTSLALLSTIFVLGLGPSGAAASTVGSISLEACAHSGEGSCAPTTTVRVDQALGIEATFRVTNPISSGNSVYVEGPVGTEFLSPSVSIGYNNSGYSAPGATVENGGRRLRVVIPEWMPTVTNASDLSISIGYFQDKVRLPPKPGAVGLSVRTSADTDLRQSSNTITTTIGLPAKLAPEGPYTVAAGGEIYPAVGALLTDSRDNPVAGQELTFTLPKTAAGGTFSGGGDEYTAKATTDAQGVASPAQAIQANTKAGSWEIAVSGPNSTTTTAFVTTIAGPPAYLKLDLAQSSLPADGQSTTQATVSMFDFYDNPVYPGELELDTGGGPSATEFLAQGDGVYASTLIASTQAGEFTITATDVSTDPELQATATLTQEVLPATSMQLTLNPVQILADGSSTTTATARVRNKLGNPVSGQDVVFTSDSGNPIGAAVDNGNGTYSAVVTSTTAVGEVTIKATNASLTPARFALASLTQLALPPSAKPPTVKIASGPKARTRAGKVTFKFSANGAVDRFECKLDKRRWAECSSPARLRVKLGKHVFRVRAVGPDGVAGPVVKRNFKRLPPKR